MHPWCEIPVPDGSLERLEPLEADLGWVGSQSPDGDLAGPPSPAFLPALCAHTGRAAHTIDIRCLAHAFLAAGFQPAGAEAHLTHQELGI